MEADSSVFFRESGDFWRRRDCVMNAVLMEHCICVSLAEVVELRLVKWFARIWNSREDMSGSCCLLMS